jgi:hypothetical protein
MKDYLQDAKDWVADSTDLSVEQLESVVETLGYKISDNPGMDKDQVASIREAMTYLNGKIYEFIEEYEDHDADRPVAHGEMPEAAAGGSDSLDFSPLVPESDGPAEELSKSEKEKQINDLLKHSGLSRGMKAPLRKAG